MQRSPFVRLGKLCTALTIFPFGVATNARSGVFPIIPRAALALMTAFWLASPWPAHAAQQILKGRHVPPATKRLTPIRRLESDTHLDLAIGLPLRNRSQLTNLLQDIYQPSSPNFRHFLSADDFASSYGPSQEDYQSVIDFAKSHGLTVKHTHPNRTLVDVSGSVGDIEKAFHVHMHVFQHPVENRTFFAPDVEPTVDIATPLLAISGLDSYVRPHPHIHRVIRPAVRPLGGGTGGGGGGGNCDGTGEGFFGYAGYDFQAAYVPLTVLDGTGQSVGLFELSGYSSDDIDTYVSEYDLPGVTTVQNIFIDGADGDDSNEDFAIEATSDIEMALAMAPNLSKVLVYQAPTPDNEPPAIQYPSTTAQINDVFNHMATDNQAKQLSCSYGMDINLSTVQIFEQFAAQGQSLFQAAGDSGAYPAAVDEPSDDPYMTIVGGTTLGTDADGLWCSETVWLTPAGTDPLLGIYTPFEATGGGFSRTYGIPAWQQGISMTANQGSTTMRNLPDVASVANNVDIVYGNDDVNVGFSLDLPVAGTSLAAPLWAAFMALVNQQAAANGQPPVGFANPALYAIGKSTNYSACFHDITSGNNFSSNSPAKYSATTGYDLCTGWGTINDPLISALLAPPSENLVVAPPTGFTSFGPDGGPYTVTSQTYTLTNVGTKALNWYLANTSQWLTVSATAGTLGPGAGTSVTVSLNTTFISTNFLIGNYDGNTPFLDLTDGIIENREFDLYIGNGGFETGDFTDWTFAGSTNQNFALAGDDGDVGGVNALDYNVPDELFVHSGLYGAYFGQSNAFASDAVLSQTLATKAGQRYLVSFWLTCVPDNGKNTPNIFIAKWNSSNLFSKANLNPFGWTNMQYIVTATGASTPLEFDFLQLPGAFGLDDVTVETVPAPVLQSVTMSGGNVTLTWNSYSNLSYQVQSATSLVNPNWTNVAAPITATSNLVSASESTGTAPQRFYRVVLLPGP